MTADQLALANLEMLRLQTWITGLAIILGPLSGVLFTLWVQRRKDRKDAEMRVFITLLANRKGTVTPEVSSALNSIDVVFSRHEAVRNLWHRYYALLHQPPGEERGHVWLQLLETMGKALGFRGLTTIDLDKFYIPQGHQDEFEFKQRMGQHWERVLQNTAHFVVASRAADGAGEVQVVQVAPSSPVGNSGGG